MTKSAHGDPLCRCGTRLGTRARRDSERCKACEIRCRPLFAHCETPGCVGFVPVTRYPNQWRVCRKCRRAKCVICGRSFVRKSRRQVTCAKPRCRAVRGAQVEKQRFAAKGRISPRPQSLTISIKCGACGVWFTYIAKRCPSGTFPPTRCYCNYCRRRQQPSIESVVRALG